MNEIMTIAAGLPDLSVSQMAALPHERLQELDILLNEMQTQVKQGRAALVDSGRDFGVAHVSDGPLRVTYELPKRVSWDQPRLAEIAERIVAAGERVQDYMDVDLSVPESRFNNWPPALKEQFTAARTVKPGKAAFRLALVNEGI